jgi:hypothetical protein
MLLLAVLLLMPRVLSAQVVTPARQLQRLISAYRLRQFQQPAQPAHPQVAGRMTTASLLPVEPRVVSSPLVGLAHRLTLPLGRDADLSMAGRIGGLGVSSSLRVRFRFRLLR